VLVGLQELRRESKVVRGGALQQQLEAEALESSGSGELKI